MSLLLLTAHFLLLMSNINIFIYFINISQFDLVLVTMDEAAINIHIPKRVTAESYGRLYLAIYTLQSIL
jgi:hypothetical protein